VNLGKLWQKQYTLNELMEKFTVGEDYLLDANLAAADSVASMAHATMLESIGILTKGERDLLVNELREILKLAVKGEFQVTVKDEDCHTAIENRLTSTTGEAGRKIHTGRSRNDQVIAALRLFTREFLLDFRSAALAFIKTLLDFAGKHRDVPMPGRTHMQIAMPSSVGLWAGSFAEQLLDDLKLVDTAYRINNQSPLGSAASYGVPLPLNRELVADLLAFDKVQNNVLYVQNSRGKIESIILDSLEQVLITVSKLTYDLFVFSLPEFGYFILPDELCTGSSIMPQKKNPDGLELLRAKASVVAGYAFQVKNIIRSLPTGYNRDFQETKGPFMKAALITHQCVLVADLTVKSLKVDADRLKSGFTPGIYATDAALDLVKSGMPFRDAYRKIGANLDGLKSFDPEKSVKAKTHTGTTGNLNLDIAVRERDAMEKVLQDEYSRVNAKLKDLAGVEVKLIPSL
jgi:argininosuccinate lyase